jgi:hypothetical protein
MPAAGRNRRGGADGSVIGGNKANVALPPNAIVFGPGNGIRHPPGVDSG